MKDLQPTCRLAVIQAAPVLFDLCRRTRAAQCLRPVPARFWNRCSPAFPQIRQAGRTVDAPFVPPRPRHCTDVFWTVHSP